MTLKQKRFEKRTISIYEMCKNLGINSKDAYFLIELIYNYPNGTFSESLRELSQKMRIGNYVTTRSRLHNLAKLGVLEIEKTRPMIYHINFNKIDTHLK